MTTFGISSACFRCKRRVCAYCIFAEKSLYSNRCGTDAHHSSREPAREGVTEGVVDSRLSQCYNEAKLANKRILGGYAYGEYAHI